jgi:hypothetical protein
LDQEGDQARGGLGELIRAAQEAKLLADKGKPKKAHDGPLKLSDVGLERHQAQRAQRLADIPAEKWDR